MTFDEYITKITQTKDEGILLTWYDEQFKEKVIVTSDTLNKPHKWDLFECNLTRKELGQVLSEIPKSSMSDTQRKLIMEEL
jgi:hypothetical protein